jgi:predicted nucleotidyltransferase
LVERHDTLEILIKSNHNLFSFARDTDRDDVNVSILVDGSEVARTTVTHTVPVAFTASETFDVGIDLGSPVSRDYFDRGPFQFEGKIVSVKVKLK